MPHRFTNTHSSARESLRETKAESMRETKADAAASPARGNHIRGALYRVGEASCAICTPEQSLDCGNVQLQSRAEDRVLYE